MQTGTRDRRDRLSGGTLLRAEWLLSRQGKALLEGRWRPSDGTGHGDCIRKKTTGARYGGQQATAPPDWPVRDKISQSQRRSEGGAMSTLTSDPSTC